jgi:hypothetical protein
VILTRRNPEKGRLAAERLRSLGLDVHDYPPGWVQTDMGGPSAPLSLEEGVDTIVWLATLPDGGPHGGFSWNRMRIDW